MGHSRFIFIILAGAILGASIEYMKSVNPANAKLNRMARLEKLMVGGSVIYQPFGKRASTKHKSITSGSEVAGLDPAQEKTGEVIVPAIKPDPAAAKKDDKKKTDKKKKKKKKKKKTIKGKGEETSPDDSDSDEDESEPTSSLSPSGGGVGGAFSKNDLPKEPQTAEEWIAFLLRSPDADEIIKFVKLYQNGAVKSDVYYDVVTAMLTDEREQVREFGVMSLGSTPSVKSFSMLVDFVVVEPGLTRPKQQANAYLEKLYTRLEYVRYLAGVLTSTNQEAVMKALYLLDVAAAIHLKGGTTEPGELGGETPRTPASNLSKYFDPVRASVELLFNTTPNDMIRTGAQRTLANLGASVGST